MSEENLAGRPDASPHFHRAVRRERDAIIAHEAGAEQQDSAAALFETRAHNATEPGRTHTLQLAAELRRRAAAAARGRAQLARQRLRAEGIDPDSTTLNPPTS